MNLIERVEATQKTVDRFKGQEFRWGKCDCAQLVIVHARHMGRRIKIPRYGDVKSAADVLKRQLGRRTLGAAMDEYFTRIEPARVMAGDFVEVLGGEGFSSMMVAVGNGRAIGFHEDVPHADILQPVIVSGAWRIG